ncbi:PHM/PNGase F [Gonapodya prolifera JEL478]|uniref:PHM/PNGase F n=1 Tax=Gonapodya prolifera (strain JEL478) TaxID=1344416 RepID=A0A139AV63_GONPJ|nr:PHM/PNGase F [Gonapodya prolifera JEL478]|eukprot:KXS20636.1 PHM/PNGase F [Gonapodya prolifera JEL478]
MRSLLFAVIVVCSFTLGARGQEDLSWVPQPILALRLEGNITLSPTAHLFWSVNQAEGTATFAIANRQPPTWLGFGLSETGSMRGADIALLRKNSSGGLYLTDMHASDFVPPTEDMSQDLTLITAFQNDNITAFAFRRKIDAQCIDEDLTVRLSTNQWVITAFGSTDNFAYHGPNNRAAKDLWLLDPQKNFVQFVAPTDAQTLELLGSSKPYTVPMEDTVYCYSFHTLPNDTSYHVVMEEAITSPAVHHVVAYRCSAGAAAKARAMYSGAGNETQCAHISLNPADGARVFNPCTQVWAAWGLGQGPLIMPDNVGKPFGNDTSYSPIFLMLEIHYDNTRRLNITDQSGFRLTYTKTLRKYSMGTMTLGTDFPWITIPQGQASYSVPGVCPQDCTSQFTTPLNVFGNFFHMHMWGKEMHAKVVRDGRELIDFRVRYWDNNIQSLQKVSNFALMPGDNIQTVCTYDTTKSNGTVLGGYATYNEMCFLFLLYYPAVTLPTCLVENSLTTCSYGGKSKITANQLPLGISLLPGEANAPGAMCPAPAVNVSSPAPPVSSNSSSPSAKPGGASSVAKSRWSLALVLAGAGAVLWL